MLNNIIFDLGVVLIDIKNETDWYQEDMQPVLGEAGLKKAIELAIFEKFEAGEFTPMELWKHLLEVTEQEFSYEELKDALIARLQTIPDKKWRMLNELSQWYNLYLLSNTNEIHILWIKKYILESCGQPIFDAIFKKQYYSHELKMAKPHRKIYEFVLQDAQIKAAETVFIDDSIANLEQPNQMGIQTIHYQNYHQMEAELNNLRSL